MTEIQTDCSTKQNLLPEQHFNLQLTTKPILRVKQNKDRHHGLVSSDKRERVREKEIFFEREREREEWVVEVRN